MYPMASVLFRSSALVAGLLLLGACGGGEKSPGATAEVPAPAAEPVDPASAATITGNVTFSGEKPVSKPISMDAVPACASQYTGPIPAKDTVIGAKGELANVFVYVKAGLPSRQWPVPSTSVALDQKGCVYSPRVLGIQVGQDLEITNNDPNMHNVHPIPRNNREWNTSQAPKGEKIVKQFEKEEVMVPFKCNVHPWMKAYIGVLPHPFFAVTGEDGHFSIGGLPPGDYTLEAWHERLGTQQIQVTVGARETKSAAIGFKN